MFAHEISYFVKVNPLYLGSRRVQGVKFPRIGTIGVVPPIADQHCLVKNRSLGTQEAILTIVAVAVMVDLENKYTLLIESLFLNYTNMHKIERKEWKNEEQRK